MTRLNSIVTMTENALENYGEQWRGVSLRVTHKATAYMPASEFYDKGRPNGFHPGFDEGAGCALYDLEIVDTNKPLAFSLYQWEIN